MMPPLWGYKIQFVLVVIFIIALHYAGDVAPLGLRHLFMSSFLS